MLCFQKLLLSPHKSRGVLAVAAGAVGHQRGADRCARLPDSTEALDRGFGIFYCLEDFLGTWIIFCVFIVERQSCYATLTPDLVRVRDQKTPVSDLNLGWLLLLLLQCGVLQRCLEILQDRLDLFFDSDPVNPEDNGEEGGSENDEDNEESAGDGVVRAPTRLARHAPHRSALKLLDVYDSFA